MLVGLLPRLIFCALLITLHGSVTFAQKLTGWTDGEVVSGTDWVYTQRYEAGKLVQCQVDIEAPVVDGTVSRVSIAVLSKGTALIIVDDSDWRNRIDIDFGWEEGLHFDNILLFSGKEKIPAFGKIAADIFAIQPQRERIFLYDSFSIVVDGITMKMFNVPKMSIAWKWLSRCQLRKH